MMTIWRITGNISKNVWCSTVLHGDMHIHKFLHLTVGLGLGSVTCILFLTFNYSCIVLLCLLFVVLCLVSLMISQDGEESLQNNLFCAEWD